MSLSDKECNIAVNKIDMDKSYDIVICPECRRQATLLEENTACHNCSEKDPVENKWIKRVNFIKISMRGKESLDFRKGFFTEDVKECFDRIKKRLQSTGEINEAGDVDSHMIYIGEIFEIINEEAGEELIEK